MELAVPVRSMFKLKYTCGGALSTMNIVKNYFTLSKLQKIFSFLSGIQNWWLNGLNSRHLNKWSWVQIQPVDKIKSAETKFYSGLRFSDFTLLSLETSGRGLDPSSQLVGYKCGRRGHYHHLRTLVSHNIRLIRNYSGSSDCLVLRLCCCRAKLRLAKFCSLRKGSMGDVRCFQSIPTLEEYIYHWALGGQIGLPCLDIVLP